jgi:hypothetical protein
MGLIQKVVSIAESLPAILIDRHHTVACLIDTAMGCRALFSVQIATKFDRSALRRVLALLPGYA